MLDVLATGYPSLDYICQVSHSPSIGETSRVLMPPSHYTFGGCGANIAVGLAHLGFRSGVAMVLGDDRSGQAYVTYLNEAGIDTRDILCWTDAATSESHLYINPEGEYQNFFYAGAAEVWQGELVLQSLAEAQYAILTVGPLVYNQQFVQLVRQADRPLIWQLKPDVYAYPYDALAELASSSLILMMNRIEADYLTTTMQLDTPADLLSEDTQLVVVTLGTDGSRIFHGQSVYDVPVVPANRLVDTTGVGDGFTSGFLAGWLQDRSPLVCAQMGAVVASFVLETVGCQTNLPDWVTMKQRYEENYGEL